MRNFRHLGNRRRHVRGRRFSNEHYQGKNYQAVSPQDAPGRLPGADGIVQETGYVHGFLQIIQQTAVFTVVDPTVTINGQQLQFQLLESATDPVPLCA